MDNKNNLLYASTNHGSVRIYRPEHWEIGDDLTTDGLMFQEIKITSSPINNLLLMQNCKKLVLSEENGNIMCFNIENPSLINSEENGAGLEMRNNVLEIAEESFLIPNFKVKEDKNTIKYLQSEIQRLKRVKIIEKKNL